MQRGSNILRRAYNKMKKPKKQPLQNALITIQGFNVRHGTSSSSNKQHSPPQRRASALQVTTATSSSPPRPNYSSLTKNELQKLINRGAFHLENVWIQKTAEQNSFKNLRKILDSGAIRSRKHYTALENAWFNKLIKYGTVNNLNAAMKLNGRYATAIANAWSLRRIPKKNLSRLVNRGIPATTIMGYNTALALASELKRRG